MEEDHSSVTFVVSEKFTSVQSPREKEINGAPPQTDIVVLCDSRSYAGTETSSDHRLVVFRV